MISTLDVMSEGRIELEIGAGWHKEEYIQYGYDFPPLIRIEQLEIKRSDFQIVLA